MIFKGVSRWVCVSTVKVKNCKRIQNPGWESKDFLEAFFIGLIVINGTHFLVFQFYLGLS